MKKYLLRRIKEVFCILFFASNFHNTFAVNYGSSAVTQITTAAIAGVNDQEILQLRVTGSGGGTNASVCSIQFTMQNTDDADISNAKLYYTGTSSTYATTTLLGTIPNPTGTVTFTINHQVITGTNYYYWLAYDIKSTAPNCNAFDAYVPTNGLVTFNAGPCGIGTNRTPSTNNPTGSRVIQAPGCWTYCIPSYTTATEPICQVIFNTINNSSSCAVGGASYEDYTAVSTTVSSGFYYTITVYGNTAGNYTDMINVFFDWNNNGVFTDGGEVIQLGTITNCANCAVSGSIAVPTSATLGNTRMRVMKKWNAYSTSCNTGAGYGQAEDYTISITAVAHCINSVLDADEIGIDCGGADCFAPVAGSVTGGNTYACGSGNYTLTLSGYSGSIIWQYSTDGSTWYDMATSNSSTLSGSVSQTTYFRAKVTGGNCNPVYTTVGAGSTINITGSSTKTWTGASSQLWATPSNWNPDDGFAPNSCTDVIIPNVVNDPIVGAASSQCRNLTIDGGFLVVDLSGVNSFTVNGDFIIKNGGSLRQDHSTANTTSSSNDLISLAAPLGNINLTGGSLIDNSNGYGPRFVIKTNANYYLQSNFNPYFFRNESTSSISFNTYTFIMSEGGRFDQDASTAMMYANTGTFENQGGTLNAFPAALVWQQGTFYTNYASSSVNVCIGADDDFYNIKIRVVPPFTAGFCQSGSCANNFEIVTGTTVNAGALNVTVGESGNGSRGTNGNFINNGTFNGGTGTVIMKGENNQLITGSSSTTFNNLTINNTSSTGVIVQTACSVNTTLTLTDGILNTDNASQWVYLPSAATVSPVGGSANSYVDGYIYKNGTSAFVFPTGDGTKWARIGITAPAAATQYGAKYFNSGYGIYTLAAGPPTLTDVSAYEYWELNQMVGSSNVQVTLYWEDALGSGINDCDGTPDDLRVAHWNNTNSNWEINVDGTVYSGTCGTAGSIQSNAVQPSYSPFTFGSKSLAVNPLPVTLVSFDAAYNGKEVDIIWATTSETNNDYFTVERSKDGTDFTPVTTVDGAGNSREVRNYATVDREPYTGVSYYRLKQTDFDGRYAYSDIVAVTVARTYDFSIRPNPAKNILNVSLSCTCETEVAIEFTNIIGKPVKHVKYFLKQGAHTIPVDIHSLRQGLYFVKVSTGDPDSYRDVYMEKFVKE